MAPSEVGATRAANPNPVPMNTRNTVADMSTTQPVATNPIRTEPHLERASAETKPSFKTTELLTYLGAVAAIIITCNYITSGKDAHNVDYFRADKAILYIVFLTIGYLISRGLAKSGSRDTHTR